MESIGSIVTTLTLHAPLFVGFLMPVVVEVLNRDVPNDTERFIVSLLVCAVAAALLNIEALQYANIEDLIASFALVFAQSQVMYRLYFKNSFVRAKLDARLQVVREKIEDNTESMHQ